MANPETFLIWGAGGWIADLLTAHLRAHSRTVHATSVRLQNIHQVGAVLDEIKPTCVINCAGKTGRPNVDWCEDHKLETIESNVIGALVLAGECAKRGVHLSVLATGCIYSSEYSPDRNTLLSAPFTESDPPNFSGSFYSLTKAHTEALLLHYPSTLILRLRMPVSDDLHARSFVTKIKSYAHVVNVLNSHSILHDLLPLIPLLAEHRETGVLNFTNPGAISHNEVLELYRDIVEPGFTWQNFSLEEQAKVIKADRSNCGLDAGRLIGLVEKYRKEGSQVEVPEIREAYRGCFGRMKEEMQSKAGAGVA
ncbi:uncharacterized protein LTR77_003779 [Saxophila tyrrhenica]|uniref:RmlD-like substrate binding domain-containing protein n=1 Tax=Saxophila tyrrhenica TaxID=1690608 RepID=A0AAV9PI02_9PEZI|nr:hypothetical protein LTR77_003779 [Saxophila tyrrhenica]